MLLAMLLVALLRVLFMLLPIASFICCGVRNFEIDESLRGIVGTFRAATRFAGVGLLEMAIECDGVEDNSSGLGRCSCDFVVFLSFEAFTISLACVRWSLQVSHMYAAIGVLTCDVLIFDMVRHKS